MNSKMTFKPVAPRKKDELSFSIGGTSEVTMKELVIEEVYDNGVLVGELCQDINNNIYIYYGIWQPPLPPTRQMKHFDSSLQSLKDYIVRYS